MTIVDPLDIFWGAEEVRRVRPPSRPNPSKPEGGWDPGYMRQIGEEGIAPTTPYQRWLWDNYGPPRRDWFGVLNYSVLAALMALPLVLLWAVAR